MINKNMILVIRQKKKKKITKSLLSNFCLGRIAHNFIVGFGLH